MWSFHLITHMVHLEMNYYIIHNHRHSHQMAYDKVPRDSHSQSQTVFKLSTFLRDKQSNIGGNHEELYPD